MARKSYVKADEIQVKGNKIFSPVRQKWLPLTPEERVCYLTTYWAPVLHAPGCLTVDRFYR